MGEKCDYSLYFTDLSSATLSSIFSRNVNSAFSRIFAWDVTIMLLSKAQLKDTGNMQIMFKYLCGIHNSCNGTTKAAKNDP